VENRAAPHRDEAQLIGSNQPTFALLPGPIASTMDEDSFNAGPGDQQGVEKDIGATERRRSYPS